MGGNWFSRCFHRARKPHTRGNAALSEVANPQPVENPDERPPHTHHTVEENLSRASDDDPDVRQEAVGEPASRRRSLEEAFGQIKKDEGV